MKKILFGVSAATLALLYGLLVLILLIVFDLIGVDLIVSLIVSAIFLLLQFLISPFLTDLTQRWFYKTKFGAEVPEYLREFIEEVCREHKMKYPKIGYIDDGAPNAFTYGHTKNDARIVLTRGIFELLTEDEVKAVVAHELGHAVHYDMLLMTVAELVPLVLYGVARGLLEGAKSSTGGDSDDNKAAAAEAAVAAQEAQRRTETARATATEKPSVTETAETLIHELTLGPILSLGLIAAGVLACLIWFSIRHRGSRLNLWYGIAAVLLAAGAMILCFPGMNGRSYVSVSEEDAPVTVERFFRALESGDAAEADACLAYGAQSGLLNGSADEVHAAVLNALKQSWDHQLLGNCSVEKNRAWQEVQLRVLDFSRMEKDLQTETRVQLLNLARTMDRENVFDAAGNYVPAAAGMAYDRALLKLLEQPQNYYGTVGCRVELTLSGDGWKIVPSKALISALSGNLG